ncbi:MAG: GIY-YIG nuclease family protein [Opitutaceae bacterium]|nr:GIY-YIG nuclease family protein [Opitutaceae bacterium]
MSAEALAKADFSPTSLPPMLKFNTLLREAEVDVSAVKLVRHQVQKSGYRTPYALWITKDGSFELYQSIQSRPVFKKSRYVASFVATPLDETLFVGLYEITGLGKVKSGVLDPVSGKDVGGLHQYELSVTAPLKDFAGKLVVDWGKGFRAWTQNAAKQNKPVVEIRRTVGDPLFPGFLSFRWALRELVSVPVSWRVALSSVGGVYLLVDLKSGQQYVGSASGEFGFWGRCQEYATTGHGGNKRMKKLLNPSYQVTVLEVASSATNIEELVSLENKWKDKLLTRIHGLNDN